MITVNDTTAQEVSIAIAEALGHLFGLAFGVIPYVIPFIFVFGGVAYIYYTFKEFEFSFFWERDRKRREEPRSPEPVRVPPERKTSKGKATKNSKSVVDTYSEEYKLPQLPFN